LLATPAGAWVITLPPEAAEGHRLVTAWPGSGVVLVCAFAQTDVIATPKAAQRTSLMTASGGRPLLCA
jgi:hypothetical protein